MGLLDVVVPNDLRDSRLSDTEVLIKPSAFTSEESFTSDPRKRRSSSPTKENIRSECVSEKRRLNFQELECDVSLEGVNSNNTGGQRQEFAFTLYDLDGHGKITEADIASLVKTIYETLGQSITVPHYGSKTIKVKLTVSPEKKPCTGGNEETTSSPTPTKTAREVPTTSSSSNNNNTNRWSKDLNYLKSRERRPPQEPKCRRRHSFSSSGMSEDREADVSEDDDEVPLNNKLDNSAMITALRSNIYSRYKKQSSSLQRQELLQIIQANMAKNNLCFQTSSRKPNPLVHSLLASHYRQRRKPQPVARQYVNSWESPAHHAANNHTTANEMFLQSSELKMGGSDSVPQMLHQRSRSYDLPPNNRCSSHFNDECCKMKQPPTSHELKHRNRELEQARAKEQVVRWLEQDFFTPAKYAANHHQRKVNNKNHNNSNQNNNINNNNNVNYYKATSKEEMKSKSRFCSNEKHEHHHVHEHVHHHYHHYHESPIVV
ncbi:hypothetical protein V9T40_010257 [Parthenolecanium corni]|uniref:Protein naked cuticle homolog n=1 Tax=Parthenolecanium corni TaxID=536013 RepID=A0AAN9T8Z1_9HEMI